LLGFQGLRSYLHKFQVTLDFIFGVLFVGFGLKILWELVRSLGTT
jgi:threonine/homoserine/homoserine lactone efflux protein